MSMRQVTLSESITELAQLAERFCELSDFDQKVSLLQDQPEVKNFLSQNPNVQDILARLSSQKKLTILSLILIGEGDVLFYDYDRLTNNWELLNELMDQLILVESFYDTIGGIIGYHLAFIRLIDGAPAKESERAKLEHPRSIDIRERNEDFRNAVLTGLENLPNVGIIFPVGGAGDRLDLHDDVTGVPLPSAKLNYMGRSLLNGMFRDVQGMEYLYYKLFGQQVMVPIAMMTSAEKNNDFHIKEICERNHWFYRGKESVMMFMQPMTPVITKEGRWSFKSPLQLNLKPGGHGVIWKLAIDNGIFEVFFSKGVRKTIMRQVNNPLASLDGNILNMIGHGFQGDRLFGFMTCDRPVHISEGMVVIEETEKENHRKYCLKNIEYTEFLKRGIKDQPREPGSLYSIFPSNTNILFADLAAVTEAIEENPLPGMLINLKAQFPTMDEKGNIYEKYGGRLETVMQSVADHFVVSSDHELNEEEKGALTAFSLFNKRQKVHSTTKRTFKAGVYIDQTPVRSFYDLQAIYRTLLADHCHLQAPELGSFDDYLERGPLFVLDIHPALGPLFDVIGQKVRGGQISEGSELQLEIAELDMENLHLVGSLRIIADSPMGNIDREQRLHINQQGGKCELLDVMVINEGPTFPRTEFCWKSLHSRKESLEIIIHGNGEFYAKGVTFKGARRIEVADGCRVVAAEKDGEIVLEVQPVHEPTWYWDYSVQDDQSILLAK